MRKFLNFILHTAILLCNVDCVEKTLKFGRDNTMLLQVTDEWIQVALKVTEEDGPGAGDRTLLRVLIGMQAMIKPLDKKKKSESEEKSPRENTPKFKRRSRSGNGRKPSLIGVVRQITNLKLSIQ